MENPNNGQTGLGRGRKRPDECVHAAPILIEGVRYGYGARCLMCGTMGPPQDSVERAMYALQAARR